MRQCWCGTGGLEPFNEAYMLCPACGTLVSRVEDGEGYGRDYWYGHQEADLGQPSIEVRARRDMPERCVAWLGFFLKACLPPGEVLELGCAHGGFTALLGRSGFRARGLELDASVAALAGRTFGIEVLAGPLEEQDIAPGSLSAVVLMDVLEHLPDPVELLRRVGRLLAPEGVVLVQTPCLPAGATHERLTTEADPFLRMLLPAEHLYLYSEKAVRALFAAAGLGQCRFGQALFPYDMLFLAGRTALADHDAATVEAALCATPDGRMVQAMLDLAARAEAAEAQAARLAGADAPIIGGLEGVVREMASGWVSEGRLPLVVNKALARVGRVAWLWNKAVKYVLKERGRRVAPAGGKAGPVLVLVDLTPVLPGGDNGGAKLMTILLLGALRQMRPDWRFVCLTSDAAHDELAHLDAPNVTRARASGLGRLRGLSHWQGVPVDLLFCPFTMPYFHHPAVPVVSVVYDLQYAAYPQFFSPEDEAGRERTFLTAARVAERLVCISEFTRQSVLAQGQVPPGRTAAVHISLPRRLVRTAPEAVYATRTRLGLGQADYLLFPANYWPHKNHRMLLTAFGLFAASRPENDCKLVLTGSDTGLRAELGQAAQRLGLADRVVFAGYVSDAELSALLTGARALLFPSLYEGFGMPLVEAMAVGTPILCSNVTSLPEVGGEAALYFDPRRPDDMAAAMARLWDEPGLAEALVARGFERLAAIGGPADMARKYLAVFEEVLARPVSQSTAVRGLFPDGWCGGRLFVAFGPAAQRQWLRTRFSLPAKAPSGRVVVTTLVNGRAVGQPVTLTPGRSVSLDPDLPPTGGCVEFVLDGARRGNGQGAAADRRRLSVHCEELRLTDGERDVDLRYTEATHG
ncbi:glycosyltransferase [Desulfovibrio sp. TomC]|uniref:glycosyltransferase n=1 Tax=Desulfovibrio sp. TomC TaxID=1562888 RepID=UPI000574A07A|nr:glycosyltransferase [Desulfovibrio sp. TomC]KHK04541.1 putative glycosyltransferase, group 1 family protein [Desulfovibrio sp. TomC]